MCRKKNSLVLMLILAWITYTAAYLCRVNISTVLDKLSIGMHVDVEYLGIASSVYFVSYAVGQLLNGFIGDRVNPHRYVMLALLMTGAINMFLGLQTSGLLFLIFWGLNGIFQSMFWCTLLRLLSFHTEEHQRKNVSTVMSTTSVTGYFLSWVVLSDLFSSASYRPYFLVPGVIALLLIPIWFVISRAVPFDPSAQQRPPVPPVRKIVKEYAHDRLFYISLLCTVIGAIQEGAVFWLPLIFTDVLSLGEGSLLLLMLIPLAKLSGVFLARGMLTKLRGNVKSAELCMILASLALTLVLIGTHKNTSILTVILIALMIAVINAANWYMISYLPLCFSERNIVSTLTGVFDFSTYVGAALMSGLLGVLLLRFGWVALPISWLVLVIAALALAIGGAGDCLQLRGQRRS